MILIVDGMDRCGKSTLVNSFGTSVYSHTKPPKSAQNDFAGWERNHYEVFSKYYDLLSKGGSKVVVDRFVSSVFVYGPRFRGYNQKQVNEILEASLGVFRDNKTDVRYLTIVDKPTAIIKRDDGLSLENNIESFSETHRLFKRFHNEVLPKFNITSHLHTKGFLGLDFVAEKLTR